MTSETTVFPGKDLKGFEELDLRAGIRQPESFNKANHGVAWPWITFGAEVAKNRERFYHGYDVHPQK